MVIYYHLHLQIIIVNYVYGILLACKIFIHTYIPEIFDFTQQK